MKVYLERSRNPERSTAYDLVAVEKAGRLINMDSNAPNKVVGEWLQAGGLYGDVKLLSGSSVSSSPGTFFLYGALAAGTTSDAGTVCTD